VKRTSSPAVLEADAAANAVRWTLPPLAGARAGGGPPTARELDELERSAHHEGFERGRAEGYAAGMAQARAHGEQLAVLLDRFARPLAELEGEVEHVLVNLANAVAAALLRGMAKHDPGMVAALARHAASGLPAAARDVEVILHPEDLAAVEKALPERDPRWRLVANPQLARGDVRVHSDSVRLDATLATRLANAAEALLEKGES
jgi:flagellar assembly protein FliH